MPRGEEAGRIRQDADEGKGRPLTAKRRWGLLGRLCVFRCTCETYSFPLPVRIGKKTFGRCNSTLAKTGEARDEVGVLRSLVAPP